MAFTRSRTVVWGGLRWDGSWKRPAGAGATPTAGAGAADTPHQYANRTPTWTSHLRGRYFAWNWSIPVVMLATVVATTATLSSKSCKSTIVSLLHFTSVLRKQFAANDMFRREANSNRALALRNSWQLKDARSDKWRKCLPLLCLFATADLNFLWYEYCSDQRTSCGIMSHASCLPLTGHWALFFFCIQCPV